MNVTDRTTYGCKCCRWEHTPKGRKREARAIKRRDRRAWKEDTRHYLT